MAIGELTDEDAHLYGSIDKDRIFRWIMDVAARLAAKLTAVVVFPTPPFWLAIAITLFIVFYYHYISFVFFGVFINYFTYVLVFVYKL